MFTSKLQQINNLQITGNRKVNEDYKMSIKDNTLKMQDLVHLSIAVAYAARSSQKCQDVVPASNNLYE